MQTCLFPAEFERVLSAVALGVTAAVAKVLLGLGLPPLALSVGRDLRQLSYEGGGLRLLLLLNARLILFSGGRAVQRRRQSARAMEAEATMRRKSQRPSLALRSDRVRTMRRVLPCCLCSSYSPGAAACARCSPVCRLVLNRRHAQVPPDSVSVSRPPLS